MFFVLIRQSGGTPMLRLYNINQREKAEEALYGEAIVYGQPVNILIDSGAVGCIISKRFLDQVNKDIEAPTNIRIIDVTGQKMAPLDMVRNVPIQMRDIKVQVDMIVTNSLEYNVLLGNEWLKLVNANIDYRQNKITIKYEGIQQQISVTCLQKLDPIKYTVIDPTEELELEEEDDTTSIPFYKAELTDTTFQINERQYHQGFLEYLNQQSNNGSGSLDLCLCQSIRNPVFCEKCQHIQEDWTIYSAIHEKDQKYKQQIQLKKEKVIPIGELNKEQYNTLHQLLNKNKDLFAKSLQELRQTQKGEHAIITEEVPPIKK
jgi:predicted aspartyl protease